MKQRTDKSHHATFEWKGKQCLLLNPCPPSLSPRIHHSSAAYMNVLIVTVSLSHNNDHNTAETSPTLDGFHGPARVSRAPERILRKSRNTQQQVCDLLDPIIESTSRIPTS
jgi:hypothetical protein